MVTWRKCIRNQTWCVWHHSILLSDYGLVMCWPLSNSKVRIDPADVIDLLFKVVWLMTYWSCRICWLNAYYWWQLENLFTKLPIISLVTVMCYHWGIPAMTRILTIYFIQILCVNVLIPEFYHSFQLCQDQTKLSDEVIIVIHCCCVLQRWQRIDWAIN